MQYYPSEFIDALKEKADIVSIISHFIPLKKVGNNYLGRCPFHNDQTPSMQVNPKTNTFYCHGCGAGSRHHSEVQSSDVYSFVMNYNKMNFKEAVEWVARFIGEPLPILNPEEQSKIALKESWYVYCKKAADRFYNNLVNNDRAMLYLSSRGFTEREIEIWRLGFGDNVDYDFRNTKDRITFACFDPQGNIISFTGRILPGDERQKNAIKYLDRYPVDEKSPQFKNHPFPHFDKGSYLYGAHIAKDYIRQWRSAVLVEGWTDVIKLHQYGIKNSVSTMGIGLTDKQAGLLLRLGAQKVISMRDGDEAGEKAAERDAKVLQGYGIQTFILPLPNGLDPFDLAEKLNDKEALSKYIQKNMRTINQWKIYRIYKETQDEIMHHHAQISYYENVRMRKVIEILAAIEDDIELDVYIRQTADLFERNYEVIRNQVLYYRKHKKHLIA